MPTLIPDFITVSCASQSLVLAYLTMSKRSGTSYPIEIHFAVVNHLIYILFSFVKLVET